ncbi:hypothetical protein D3C84_1187660 [compost metagenome]
MRCDQSLQNFTPSGVKVSTNGLSLDGWLTALNNTMPCNAKPISESRCRCSG